MKNIRNLVLLISIVILFSGVNVYAATVGDSLDQPEAGWKRVDNLDTLFNYEGNSWSIKQGVPYWLQSVHITDKQNESIKFSFNGSKIRIISGYCSQLYSDDVTVKIDGVEQSIIWNYDRNTYNILVFEKTGLEDKMHDVEIINNKDLDIVFDAIDIDDGTLVNQTLSPTNVNAIASDSNITLNWDAVSDADSYTILRSTTSGAIDTVIASNITETTYTDTSVTPGVTYYYVVRAVKNDVESADSNIASAMVEENTNFANLQIKLSTTDIYEYRMTMSDVDAFKNWYIDRANGTGLPFYSFSDDANIEPYTDINEYLIFDKIVWFKVKEYFK